MFLDGVAKGGRYFLLLVLTVGSSAGCDKVRYQPLGGLIGCRREVDSSYSIVR